MVKRKRLAKRFLVVALTLCMIAASTQKPVTVRAEENVTTTETDSEDTDTNDGNQKGTTESNSTIEEDTTGKDTDENGEATAANLDEDADSAEQNGVTSGSDSDEDAGDSGDDTGDSGEDADGDDSAEDASAGTAASGSETEDESSDDDSAAAEYGILLASEEEEETAVSTLSATSTVSLAEPEIDKTATSLDENNQTTVTLTIGAGSGVENVAVLFLLDKSTSTAVKVAATDMLTELAAKTNTNILYDVVVFSGTADSSGWTSDLTLENGVAKAFVDREQTSGTNMSAGILKAIEDMKTLASQYPEYDKTYLVTVSDGITYFWTVSGETTVNAVAVQAYGNSGNIENEVQIGTDTWSMMYSYGTTIASIYESFASFLTAIPTKMNATTNYGAVVSVGTNGSFNASSPLTTYIYDSDSKKNIAATYACGPEFALYYSATYYKELLTYFDYSYAFAMPETTSSGSDNETNWQNYPWGEELMQYCQSLSTNYNWPLSYSNSDAELIFNSILDQIFYEIAEGSITDVIGADFTLTDAGAITEDTFSLTVNGTKLKVTAVEGNVVTFENGFVLTYYQGTTTSNGDGTYTITATDASGKTVTCTYTPCDTSDEVNGSVSDEFFILTFGTAVVSLELTYNLTLTSLKTADGTYMVPTNETAVLDYTPTQGTEDSMEFPEPTVVYVVTSETETTDPTPDTSTETETETTEPTEVVSAATGDSTPLELAVFIAVISGFTLLFQWQALKRKKSFQEKG